MEARAIGVPSQDFIEESTSTILADRRSNPKKATTKSSSRRDLQSLRGTQVKYEGKTGTVFSVDASSLLHTIDFGGGVVLPGVKFDDLEMLPLPNRRSRRW
jgi:hypothetical protein